MFEKARGEEISYHPGKDDMRSDEHWLNSIFELTPSGKTKREIIDAAEKVSLALRDEIMFGPLYSMLEVRGTVMLPDGVMLSISEKPVSQTFQKRSASDGQVEVLVGEDGGRRANLVVCKTDWIRDRDPLIADLVATAALHLNRAYASERPMLVPIETYDKRVAAERKIFSHALRFPKPIVDRFLYLGISDEFDLAGLLGGDAVDVELSRLDYKIDDLALGI